MRQRFEGAAAAGLVADVSYDDDAADHEAGHVLHPVRTMEENREREGEVQDLLDRPRNPRGLSGVSHEVEIEAVDAGLRKRQHSESGNVSPQEHKISFAVTDRGLRKDNDDDHDGDDEDANGKKPRRSTDVHDLLKKGFGSVRKSLDMV